MCIIIFKGRDASEITVISVNTEIFHGKIFEEDISVQTDITVCIGIQNDILKILAVHNDDIQADVCNTLKISGAEKKVCDSAVFGGRNDRLFFRYRAGQIHTFDSHGHIRAACDVIVDHIVEIDVADHVTVRHDDVITAQLLNRETDTFECFQTGIVRGSRYVIHTGIHVGRKDFDTAGTACEIPVLTGTDMIHKGMVIVIGDNVDVADIGVYHVGEREVDQTVAASERDGCERAYSCKLRDGMVMNIAKNDTCY